MPALPLLIESAGDLDRLCEIVESQSQIAVDTEFVRTNTYAPQLGLVQICADETIACVDPLTDMNLEHLWSLLFDPARSSLIHSASQDMEVLWFTCGQVLPTLIDTQICAALLGYPAQIGYAGLAAELVGAEISKSQTRTDWSRRPLTEAQLQYAAEDVEHLPRMHAILRERLEELGRYEWALEDSRALSRAELYEPDPDSAWQRLKSIPFLPPPQQARARALAAWREQLAIRFDKPRGWILSDKALLQIGEQNPEQEGALRKIDDLPPAVIRKRGAEILALLNAANTELAEGKVSFTQEFPDRDRDKARVKRCSAIIREAATALSIAPEVLGSKRDIQALLRGDPNARLGSGWRGKLVGEELKSVVAG
jgi:ribonuclease D